jgi:hypothetical protein
MGDGDAPQVTGVLTDVVGITVLLHNYGALSFWDYATSAPHVDIDMNPVSGSTANQQTKWVGSAAYIDAIFISPHKFIGGPETPGTPCQPTALVMSNTRWLASQCIDKQNTFVVLGVLVAKKKLWGDHTTKLGALEQRCSSNLRSTSPGGGTVFYVCMYRVVQVGCWSLTCVDIASGDREGSSICEQHCRTRRRRHTSDHWIDSLWLGVSTQSCCRYQLDSLSRTSK